MEERTHILSIDIGTRNFAFWMESYPTAIFSEKCVTSYNQDGTAQPATQSILEKVAMSGKTVLFANEDIQTGVETKNEVSNDTLCTLTEFLDSNMDAFSRCDYIVVEKQMQFGKIRNTRAVRVAHHVQSYFLIKFGRLAQVFSFPAYHKTQVSGKVRFKSVDKPTRKKWAVSTAEDILLARRDFTTIEKMALMKKRDDVSDCLLQSIAFCVVNLNSKKF
jgi:hypothetical protein